MKTKWWLLLVCLTALTARAGAQDAPLRWMAVPAEQSGLGPADERLNWPWISKAVDIDGDGDLDFCVYGHHGRKDAKGLGGTWYLNDGKGRFTVDRNLDRWDMGTIDGVWWDFSGDGVPDHVAYEARVGTWYLNDGKGNFSAPLGKVLYSGPLDVDGDGVFEEFALGMGRFGEKTRGLVKLEPPVSSIAGKPLPQFTVKMLQPADDLGVDPRQGLPETSTPSLNVSSVGDLNGDGMNDLIVRRAFWRYKDDPRDEAMRSWVLLGTRDGKPVAANVKLGLPDEGKHGFVPVDLSGDGVLDIADVHSGDIFLGDGKGRFAKSEARLFPDDPKWKNKVYDGDGPLWVEDFGNTGAADLFVGFAHGYPKYGGQQAGLFVNDGRLGFRRELPDWAAAGRRSSFYTALGDFDGDGWTDAVVINQKLEVVFYRNEGIPGNHWLKVKTLQKARGNGALGCKLWVYRAGRLGEKDALVTSSERGDTSGVLHVGLGKADVVDLRLRFPISGKVVEQRNVKADQVIELKEE